MSVKIEGLTKRYGKQNAVDNISFSAEKGEIIGFLGPNGAGKSTTMKITTSFIPPDEGKVIVNGYDVVENPLEVRKITGYLPEHNPLYLDMYVHEYLRFIGGIHGMSGRSLKSRVNEMVSLCGLEKEQIKKIGALSKGYRQRVGLAQALIHDPEVLILDEPTTGLDPNQIVEIRSLIKEFSKDKTVIFSTHIMQEVQAICQRVVIINNGKIVADEKVENLNALTGSIAMIYVEFVGDIDVDMIRQLEGVIEVNRSEEGKYEIKAESEVDIRSKVFDLASTQDWKLIGMNKKEESLEDIFQKLTRTEQ